MRGSHQFDAPSRETCFLTQLSSRGRLRRFGLGASPFGDLPRIYSQRIAVLTHQPDGPVVLDRQDTDGPVLELDHAVDARQAVRAQHLVFANPDPWVLIDDAAG